MPTGKDQQNLQGLMKSAEALLLVQTQVQSFVKMLSSSKELATQLDDAVMREDREAIQNLLREQGIKGEISIIRLDPDRQIELRICAILGFFVCASLIIAWE